MTGPLVRLASVLGLDSGAAPRAAAVVLPSQLVDLTKQRVSFVGGVEEGFEVSRPDEHATDTTTEDS